MFSKWVGSGWFTPAVSLLQLKNRFFFQSSAPGFFAKNRQIEGVLKKTRSGMIRDHLGVGVKVNWCWFVVWRKSPIFEKVCSVLESTTEHMFPVIWILFQSLRLWKECVFLHWRLGENYKVQRNIATRLDTTNMFAIILKQIRWIQVLVLMCCSELAKNDPWWNGFPWLSLPICGLNR